MGQRSSESADEDMLAWVRLADRLRAASPKKFGEVLRMVRGIVEGQEILRGLDSLLVLARRPTKRYSA